jgi:hypothetical protein
MSLFEAKLVDEYGSQKFTTNIIMKDEICVRMYYKRGVHIATHRSGMGWIFK